MIEHLKERIRIDSRNEGKIKTSRQLLCQETSSQFYSSVGRLCVWSCSVDEILPFQKSLVNGLDFEKRIPETFLALRLRIIKFLKGKEPEKFLQNLTAHGRYDAGDRNHQ